MSWFFTADWHLGHTNILKYCNRPFSNIVEHDQIILDNCNSVVGKDDHLVMDGDMFWWNEAMFLDRIVCKNIHFVIGSHDKRAKNFKDKFIEIGRELLINVNGQDIICNHYPYLFWERSHYGVWMLHGHHHNSLDNVRECDKYNEAIRLIRSKAKTMDVGIDTSINGHKKFFPYSFDEIKVIMDAKEGFLVQRGKRGNENAE
jgi:calcineurin-like phosphoesterase family protein